MDVPEKLFDAYAENDISDEEFQRLEAWLQERDANVDRFVRDSFLHSQLFAVVARRLLQADVMARPPEVSVARYVTQERGLKGGGRAERRLTILAATLLVVATCLIAYLALRPRAVAQITKTSPSISWQGAGEAPRAGALLYARKSFRLRSGRVMATLISGARIIVEGPAEFRIDGDNRVWLQSGRIGVEVPAQATGMLVDSPFGQFVDMGTEFTIDLNPKVGCQIQVFTGMVEMRPIDSANRPVVVSLGSAVNYDAATGDVTFLTYDESKKLSL